MIALQEHGPADTETQPIRRHGDITMHETHVSVWEKEVDERAMRQVFRGVLGRLSSRGWHVERDPQTLKNYPTLADWKWWGQKGDLQVFVETSGRACQVEFYQDVHRGKDPNPYGGRHDFDKFGRMSPAQRRACVVEMTAVIRKLLSYGYKIDEKRMRGSWGWVPTRSLLYSVLLVAGAARVRESGDPLVVWNNHWGDHGMEKDETGWPTPRALMGAHSSRDRDGVEMHNGEVRYWRDECDGYIRCGTIHKSVNGQCIVDRSGSIWWVASHRLFRCDRPDLEPRRLRAGQSERLLRELTRATEERNGPRVATLAKALDRIGWPAKEKKRS